MIAGESSKLRSTRHRFCLVLLAVAAWLALSRPAESDGMKTEQTDRKTRIALIGASVGKAWDLAGLPARSGIDRYLFTYVGCYRFDKSIPLGEILGASEGRPDAIILKECAAYFPRDVQIEEAKALMRSWVDACIGAGVTPIPATVIPVTRAHDDSLRTKNPVKRFVKALLGRSTRTRMDGIDEYNAWLRGYARERGLHLLDLGRALTSGERHRYLPDEYTSGDGLHLNGAAYRVLDRFLLEQLDSFKIGWGGTLPARSGSGQGHA